VQKRRADVAQLVEQLIRNQQVIGSSPIVGSILNASAFAFLVPAPSLVPAYPLFFPLYRLRSMLTRPHNRHRS
jgi:hypothetical protein